MLHDELHQRYGSHIAKRVQKELTAAEFSKIEVRELVAYLELRAEAAHKEYQCRLNNPLGTGAARNEAINDLCHRWREAEDLAYLISVAEDVCANARQNTLGAKV